MRVAVIGSYSPQMLSAIERALNNRPELIKESGLSMLEAIRDEIVCLYAERNKAIDARDVATARILTILIDSLQRILNTAKVKQ